MFFVTAKFSKKKAIIGILAFGIVMCLLVVCSADRKVIKYNGDEAMDTMSHTALKTVKDDTSRIDFLSKLGWETAADSVESKIIVIPEEFDQTYTAYNKIQTENGYDLSKYRGKTAELYTYIITNYPTGEEDVRANMIIYKNKLIGGDICSSKLDGSMHGLSKRTEIN